MDQFKESFLQYKEVLNNFLRPLQPVSIDKDFIRVGGPHDGGYVVVDDFKKTDFLITLGAGRDIEFEKQLNNKIKGVDLYDEQYVDYSGVLNNYRLFHETIGVENGETTLHQCIDRVPDAEDLILKIDIEGAEWDILDSISDNVLNRFKQIIIEFHYAAGFLYPDRFEPRMYKRALRVFNKINETHLPVHAHINTTPSPYYWNGQNIPHIFEMTYFRKNNIGSNYKDRLRNKPELLDAPNSPKQFSITFPYLIQ